MDNPELLRRYAETRDPQLRNRIVEQNMPLAGMVAKRFAGRGVEYDDLIQIASFAMVKALERFQPEQNVKLSTYLIPTMIGEVRHYFRDRAGSIRMPRTIREGIRRLKEAEQRFAEREHREPSFAEVAEEAGIELSQALDVLEAGNALETVSINQKLGPGDETELEQRLGREEEGYERVERSALLSGLMISLSGTEKQLLDCRYRMDLNQRETALRMNVSQMTVSRMEKKIIEKLRKQAGIDPTDGEKK